MNENNPTYKAVGGGTPMDETQMQELITSAGYRPTLPEKDLEAIRAAAKAEWQDLVSRQSATTTNRSGHAWALAASLILVIAAAWWWISASSRVDPSSGLVVATIEVVEGDSATGLSVGEEIVLGSTIETPRQVEGTPHRLALRLAGGVSLRVDSSSELVFSDEYQIELRAGAVYVDTGSMDRGSRNGSSDPVSIITDFGVVDHVGTQYEVRLLDSEHAVRVRVREGRVSLRSETGSFPVESGQQLKLDDEGREELTRVPTHGSEWSWMTEAAPGIDIDRLPIRSYLEWLSRETGRTLIFESVDVETYAADYELGGTIEGFTPMESLEVVRLSTDLDIEIQNGSIVVFGPK